MQKSIDRGRLKARNTQDIREYLIARQNAGSDGQGASVVVVLRVSHESGIGQRLAARPPITIDRDVLFELLCMDDQRHPGGKSCDANWLAQYADLVGAHATVSGGASRWQLARGGSATQPGPRKTHASLRFGQTRLRLAW